MQKDDLFLNSEFKTTSGTTLNILYDDVTDRYSVRFTVLNQATHDLNMQEILEVHDYLDWAMMAISQDSMMRDLRDSL